MESDYKWGSFPPGPIERQVRAEERQVRAELETLRVRLAAVEELIGFHEEHKDGRVPACQLRNVLGLSPRPRPYRIAEAS